MLAAAGAPATAGPAQASPERWPLSYQGTVIGTLVAQPRRGEQAFDPRDRAVCRHSGARSCAVRLRIETGRPLLVEVGDDGAGGQPWGAGVGLPAMRERAAELGGTLTAGSGPHGGLVRACFPLPDGDAS